MSCYYAYVGHVFEDIAGCLCETLCYQEYIKYALYLHRAIAVCYTVLFTDDVVLDEVLHV